MNRSQPVEFQRSRDMYRAKQIRKIKAAKQAKRREERNRHYA